LPEFQGTNPYFLLWVTESGHLLIDLDESGWMARHGHIFREAGDLYLVDKEDQSIILSVNLAEGEQGYYVARHVGNTGVGETIAYGIGKKRVDGNEDNLWVFEWGQVCAGKDVERFAIMGLRSGLTNLTSSL